MLLPFDRVDVLMLATAVLLISVGWALIPWQYAAWLPPYRVFSSFSVAGSKLSMDDTELEAATAKLLADADADKDGKVSFEEFGACGCFVTRLLWQCL